MTKTQNLIIRQGANFSFSFIKYDSSGSVVDLTGYSAEMGIKIVHGAGDRAYLHSDESKRDGGTIEISPLLGKVTISMTSGETQDLLDDVDYIDGAPVPLIDKRARCVYDLNLISPTGHVTREIEGLALIDREVTTG